MAARTVASRERVTTIGRRVLGFRVAYECRNAVTPGNDTVAGAQRDATSSPADSLPPSGRSLIHRSTCGAPSRSFGSLTKTSRGSSPDGAGDVTRHRTAVSTGAVGARDRANGVSEGLVRGATERANRRERVRESVGEERGVSSRPATALVRSPIHPATSPRTTPSTRRKQFRSSRAVRSPRAAARTARRS
jgi:hypothetical protein